MTFCVTLLTSPSNQIGLSRKHCRSTICTHFFDVRPMLIMSIKKYKNILLLKIEAR